MLFKQLFYACMLSTALSNTPFTRSSKHRAAIEQTSNKHRTNIEQLKHA